MYIACSIQHTTFKRYISHIYFYVSLAVFHIALLFFWLHLQVAPLAVGVSSFAAASFDRWIYVIGGGPNGKLATDKVQCWEPGTDSWELRAPIPIETKCTNAVTFKNGIYIVGKLVPLNLDNTSVFLCLPSRIYMKSFIPNWEGGFKINTA